MIALTISSVRDFMSKLLTGTTFDRFYLLEAEVLTMGTFRIEGELNGDYYTSDEKEVLGARRYCLWSEVKPVIYQIMRGKKLPVSFRLVLALSDENTAWLLKKHHLDHLGDQLKGLYLNVRFQGNKLTCITGLSYNTFVMDKTLEHIWDDTARQYLRQSGIETEGM